MQPVSTLSIVVPVYNEEDNILSLHQKITAALSSINYKYEVVYIDDGSFDRLQQLAQQDQKVKVVQFSRNHGQTAAIAAGIDHATGDAVVFMDADLQNDPADIPIDFLHNLKSEFKIINCCD